MRIGFLLIVASISLLAGGCSSVPGDAALRSGHPGQAADLYRQGANQGDSEAALRLGLLVSQGRVSEDEYGVAGKWYEKGCRLGSNPACHNAGVGYENGEHGLEKSHEKARTRYLKAAKSGYMQSQYNLASLYSNQHVQPSDDVEGLKWMLVARAHAKQCRDADLCKWILRDPPGHKDRLEGRLTDREKAKAEQLAKQWVANNME